MSQLTVPPMAPTATPTPAPHPHRPTTSWHMRHPSVCVLQWESLGPTGSDDMLGFIWCCSPRGPLAATS